MQGRGRAYRYGLPFPGGVLLSLRHSRTLFFLLQVHFPQNATQVPVSHSRCKAEVHLVQRQPGLGISQRD